MAQTQEKTYCDMVRTEKVVYKKKSLLGIFEWYVKVSAEKLRNDIYINTKMDFEDVIVNGVKYRPDF